MEVQRFPITLTDGNPIVTLSMPNEAKVIHVGVHEATPSIWALVDVNEPTAERQFCVVGTNQPFEDKWDVHLGTYVLSNQYIANIARVFHVFESTILKMAAGARKR